MTTAVEFKLNLDKYLMKRPATLSHLISYNWRNFCMYNWTNLLSNFCVCVCVCAEIADRKLIEMKGRVNLGLNVRMVVIWVEKCEALRVWKAKFGFSVNWRLKWVNPSLKCHLGLMGKLGLRKGEQWVTKVKARAISTYVRFVDVESWFAPLPDRHLVPHMTGAP